MLKSVEQENISPAQLRRMPSPPYIIWYQCPFLDDLRHCNIDASVGNHQWAVENHRRGITSLMWVYGPNLYGEAKDWDAQRFLQYYASYAEKGYAGIAMDEWNTGDDHPYALPIAEALRTLKRKHRRFFVAVWVTEPTPLFRKLVKERAVDLAIIQGYTFVPEHPEWAISWEGVVNRIERMKRDGILRQTVVCVGMVSPTPDKFGNRMSPAQLQRQVRSLRENYPEMPGVAFYGVTGFGEYRVEMEPTKKLVLLADRLAGEVYGR
ncbi:MAG: hypothetical protein RMM06_09290 [Armatimonadota bacterium]|nr:hypothetical protein [bacterium]MCS7309966.1 hypothetical protein [Armatimonadota bacterium]MDW8104478.1 hypothetical protein [Armatimonadota bacterium]MDW8290906.1 hypothetical protein [Armatimonadota bacterium]